MYKQLFRFSVPITGIIATVLSVFTQAQTNSGTPNVIEAESGFLAGNARTYTDNAASGGQGVAFIFAVGDYVRFDNVGASDSFDVSYASENSGNISIRVNGSDRGNLSFNSTGAWVGSYQQVTFTTNIPEGAQVDIFYDNGDAAMNIDTVAFQPVNVEPTPGPTPVSTPIPTPVSTPVPGGQSAGKPQIPADGQRYFILGQDQASIIEYMNNTALPRPSGLTMYVTLARGEPSFDGSYCFKGLDGLKNTDSYNSNSAAGCAQGDTFRQNEWGSGIQNVQWAIETYNPGIISIGLWCPRNDLMPNLYNNGAYDDLLTELADFFKAYSSTSFFLRTCYEFNGDAGGWSDVNFRGTFRYVRNFLDNQNVTNVAHVWQSDSFHGTGRGTSAIGEQEQGYWPGRRFVDWVGSSQFASLVDEEAAIAEAEGLPHFIAEATAHGPLFFQYDFKLPFNSSRLAANGQTTIQNDLQWFNDKQDEIARTSTKAWHYINADWSSQPQWRNAPDQAGANFFTYSDTRIQESPEVQAFFH